MGLAHRGSINLAHAGSQRSTHLLTPVAVLLFSSRLEFAMQDVVSSTLGLIAHQSNGAASTASEQYSPIHPAPHSTVLFRVNPQCSHRLANNPCQQTTSRFPQKSQPHRGQRIAPTSSANHKPAAIHNSVNGMNAFTGASRAAIQLPGIKLNIHAMTNRCMRLSLMSCIRSRGFGGNHEA